MPLGCCCTGETRLNAGYCCIWMLLPYSWWAVVARSVASGRANTRGEGAGLSAPAAAAKQEQLAQHRELPYQNGAPGVAQGAPEWRKGPDIRWRRCALARLAVRMRIEQVDLADEGGI